MPTLTIKGIPEAIYRSLNSEIIVCLEQASSLPLVAPQLWLREADRLPERMHLSPLTESRLRRAKDTGRPIEEW